MTWRPEWQDRAACRGQTELMFPRANKYGGYGSAALLQIAQAKALCAACPVRDECAEAGRDEWHGIWGGLTPQERGDRLRPRRTPERRHGSHRLARTDKCPCALCEDTRRAYREHNAARRRAMRQQQRGAA